MTTIYCYNYLVVYSGVVPLEVKKSFEPRPDFFRLGFLYYIS